MRLIKGIENLGQKFIRPVVAIGIFDGVHLAHQRIIQQVVRRAKSIKGTSLVITFNPHPASMFSGRGKPVALITSVGHRINLLRNLGVDIVLLLDFNKDFAGTGAADFAQRILIDKIGTSGLIVGKGFHFGRARSGTIVLLKKLLKPSDVKLEQINPIKKNGKIISSSKIRALIQKGRIKQANAFLGRRFSILGKVRAGRARGRLLGYPTANIAPEQEVIPERGVYAVWVKLHHQFFPGILNIGLRPTFATKGNSPDTIEVHIFNFRKKIYGRKLEIFFAQRIRPEKRFASIAKLLAQIRKDELRAKRILKSTHLTPPKSRT